MNLHEFQAKRLFAGYRIPVPFGVAVDTPEAAREAAEQMGGDRWVVKAQAHTGGRGKAGGVVLVDSPDKVEAEARRLLGSRLVTPQTGPQGLPVSHVLVEEPSDIERELYLSLLVDRGSRRVMIMASEAGGMNIEEVAAQTPEKILTSRIDPAAGLQPWQGRRLGFALGLDAEQRKQLHKILTGLTELFEREDASLVEINPLTITGEGDLLALDAKINLDDNALYRHKDVAEMRDLTEEDPAEVEAGEYNLNFIKLDGSIGCLVNGAGLAMSTMDIIKQAGGEPANFLDVGGGAKADQVAAAFKIITADPNVRGIFINIFGGIMQCDTIADGVVKAVKEVGLKVPLVVRLEGTNVELGRKILAESGLDLISAEDMADGAQKIVERTR